MVASRIPPTHAISPRARVASMHPVRLASLVASAVRRAASPGPGFRSASPASRVASAVASRPARVASASPAQLASRVASAGPPRFGIASGRYLAASAVASRQFAASGILAARHVASAVGGRVASFVPQLSAYHRVPLGSVDVDQLASAVAYGVASSRKAVAASPADPTRLLASAIARRLTSPTFHVASGGTAQLASRLASAVARHFGASESLQTRDVDVGGEKQK